MDLFSLAGKIILDDGSVVSKLEGIDSKAKNTGTTFDEAFGKIKSSAMKLAGFLGVGLGLKEVFDETTEAQGALTQMSTVLQSTGDASGMTKQSLEELAESTSRVTEFSKNQALQGQNLMLTFTRIGKEVFPGAMEASENMATAMHMDLNSAVLQVGKALGNLSLNSKGGIEGLTMLQREGVNFSQAEKDQITTLLKANDVAGAQKVVLQELQTEFGGSAKAAGTTFGGQLKILKNNLLEVGAGIMEKLMPPIQTAVTFINGHMPQIQSTIGGVIAAVSPPVQYIIGFVETHMPQIQQLVSMAFNIISSAVQAIIPFIQPIISDIVQIAENLLPKLSGSSGNLAAQLSGVLKIALTDIKAVFDWLAQHGEAVKIAVIGIGGAFATFKAVSTVKTAVDGVKKSFDTITGVAGAVKGGFETIALKGMYAGDNIKALGSGTAGLAKSLGGPLLNGLKTAGGGFQSLFALMAANPVSIVIVAIAALVAALVVLYNNNKQFRDFVNGMWAEIKSVVITSINAIKSFFSALPAFFSGIWNAVSGATLGAVKGMGTGITTVFNAIKSFILSVWTGIKNAVMAIITPFAKAMGAAWNGVSSGISTAMNGIKTIFTSIWDAIKTAVLGVVLLLCDLITGNWTKLGEDAGKIFGKLAADMQAIWTGIQQVVTGVWTAISSFLTGLWNGIIGSAQTIFNDLISFFVTSWNTMTTDVTNAWNAIVSFLSGLWNGIVTTAQTIWNALPGFFSGLWNGILSAAQAVWDGIKSFFITFFNDEVQGWENIWNGLTGFFSGLWGGIISFFEGLPGKFSAAVQNIGSAIVHGFDSAVNFIKNLPAQMLQWGKDMINGLINGIKNAIGGIKNAVTGVADTIRSILHFSVPDEGPLADADTYGGDFIDLLSNGITDNLGKARSAALAAANTISESLKVKANIGVTGISGVPKGVYNASLPTTAETVKAAIKGGNVTVIQQFTGETPSAAEATRKTKNGLRQLALDLN